MKKIFVFDIDGTIANMEHRRQYVATKPKNWAAFNAGMHLDTVFEDIKFLYTTFRYLGVVHPEHVDNIVTIFCSGRGEENRAVTAKWLNDNKLYHDGLYMRRAGDYRQDSIVKVELLQEIRKDFGEPFLWFDDRNQVVDAIRAQGVRVLQVAPGNF